MTQGHFNFTDKKILIVTPERLGDTLMCTPAIRYLKIAFPTVEIDIIALSQLSADALQYNPDIKQIFVLPAKKFLKKFEHDYYLGINIHDSSLARDYFQALDMPVVHLPPCQKELHQAEQALLFIHSLLPKDLQQKYFSQIKNIKYQLFSRTHDAVHIEELLNQHDAGWRGHILVGCQIGCHSVAKRRWLNILPDKNLLQKNLHNKIWPVENFSKLAEKLAAINPDIKLILTGSCQELILGKKLARQHKNMLNFIGQTSVQELHALMSYLHLFISPDSGLMHVAASTDVPLLALFGPTDLTRTGPYPSSRENLMIIREKTMQEITPEKVLRAILHKSLSPQPLI